MGKRHWRTPSPALVISLIALFVALGGTSYAAIQLPKNSVGTKQLKKNAVTGQKIKNGAVTAAKINPEGLTVPSASHAVNADKLGGTPATSFISDCAVGSIAAAASWYVPGLPSDPTFVAPNRYGGEGGFACNGATPMMTKEGTGFYRMELSSDLPRTPLYPAFVNPDARGATPLYGDANFELSADGHLAWDIHVFNQAGTPTDPYYLEVLITALH